MAKPGDGSSHHLSVERALLLAGILGVSGGGSWFGSGRIADDMQKVRAEVSQVADDLKRVLYQLEDHDRRIVSIEERLDRVLQGRSDDPRRVDRKRL